MTEYTTANYHPSVLPGGISSAAKGAITYAVHLGWTLTIRRQVCHLNSPVGDQHFAIGVRSKNEDWNSIRRKAEKYGNPLVPPSVMDTEKDVEKYAVSVVNNEHARARQAEQEKNTPITKTLIKEGPMISKGGTLGGYTSNIATQREWSDDTVDYVCTRCGFVTSTPRGAGSHWGKHVREDERNRGGHKGVEIPVERPSYQPTEERLNSLAEAMMDLLKQGVEWGDPDEAARQLAFAALLWDHERRGKSEPGLREPLSDTDILNKIRALVDNGLYESQELAMTEAQARAEKAEQRAAAAEAQVEAMRANLNAFMGMMAEEFEVKS